jgi:Flp pilus assembly protein CpaB
MRPRTFLLIFLILLLAAAAVVIYIVSQGDLDVAGLVTNSGNAEAPPITEETEETTDAAAQVAPTATPSVRFVPVVVTTADVPAGSRLGDDILTVEMRPDTNIAVAAGYNFSEIDEVRNQIARVPIARGQAVLSDMIALDATALAAMGSDLALFVNQGNVAIAMPINRYSGAAYAMRAGDLVDVLMSFRFVRIDEELQTARPNRLQQVDPQALADGRQFLFDEVADGRLEVIPGVNLVAVIGPNTNEGFYPEGLLQIPRRVAQLTLQQAEVLWVGTWPGSPESSTPAAAPAAGQEGGVESAPEATPEPEGYVRTEMRPDVVILSMSPQDALTLKWALDRGVSLDLLLRSQGDRTVFVTTSVSLPQLVEQGGLTIPERGEFDLHPRADDVPPPSIPDVAPGP